MTVSIRHRNPYKMLQMRLHQLQTIATAKMLAKPKRQVKDKVQDKLKLPARGRALVVRVDRTIRITIQGKMNRYLCQARLALAQATSASTAIQALFSPVILYHTHRLLLSIRKWPTTPLIIAIFLLI